jgi:FKBP-type peptidyl-prolyl cis-trans isomerase
MKYNVTTNLLAVSFCVLALLGCNANGKTKSGSSPAGVETLDKDASYALGMNIGGNMRTDKFRPEMNDFIQGFKDGLDGVTPRFSEGEAQEKFQQGYAAMKNKQSEGQREAESAFLAENSKKPGIIVTASGLQYEVLTEGSGAKPTADDTVRVNYEGSLSNGTVFDSSYTRGEPAQFPLRGVIPGWTEGIQLMSVGGKYRFYIPSELGYGPQGAGQQIPPYSALVFEVELLDIIKPVETEK